MTVSQRRRPARGSWAGRTVRTVNAHGGPGNQPGAGLVKRRTAARAYWRPTGTETTNNIVWVILGRPGQDPPPAVPILGQPDGTPPPTVTVPSALPGMLARSAPLDRPAVLHLARAQTADIYQLTTWPGAAAAVYTYLYRATVPLWNQ